MRRRIELIWDSDTVEFPNEMRAALCIGKLGVLSVDPRESYATKRFAHVTGDPKASGWSHSAMSFGLNAGSLWRRVEHDGSVAGMASLRRVRGHRSHRQRAVDRRFLAPMLFGCSAGVSPKGRRFGQSL